VHRRLRDGLALLWGCAEATVFFIVPDVLLSWIGLRDLRRALLACLYALLGALVGGSIVWLLGHRDPEPVRSLYAVLPAIDAEMIRAVREQLKTQGILALFLGPLSGTPYKLYALESPVVGLGYVPFLLVSVPARLLRFVAVTMAAAALSRLLRRRLALQQRQRLLLLAWATFYAGYFYAMR
jgi:membrane protein YqaA with SNARE-associated domain